MAIISVFRALCGFAFVAICYQALSSILSFRRNLRVAKQSGLPYVCRVVFEFNYAFLIVQPLLSPIIDRLPRALDPSGYLDYYRKDWRVYTKHRKHQELGDVFWNVSPGLLLLEIADADVTTELTTRRTDFVKPRWVFENIRLFGPNIIEADEHDWKRHRRVIGPRYSETLHSFVWNHATSLAREMFGDWQRPDTIVPYSPGTVSREARDFGALALRVIVGAAFDTVIPFRTTDSSEIQMPAHPAYNAQRKPGQSDIEGATKFADSLLLVMSNLVAIMVFPKWLIAMSSITGRRIAAAIDEVRYYMNDMLFAEADSRKEKRSLAASEGKRESKADTTILSGLADALATQPQPGPDQLTYDEAIGNIFLMALAGSATTGDTLHFAAVLLAVHQDIQKWVCDEIDEVIKEEGLEWKYQTIFPKLTRCHHVMMETLRLYPVTPVLPKWTDDRTQTLNVGGRAVVLPPKTVTVLSFPGLHYNPKYWGDDVAEFRPQRWSTFEKPKEGSFVPFSRGARSCLGKRFSESEFVAVMSVIFREHRVELDVREGETPELVRKRAIDALDKSQTYMTLSVGDNVPLRWIRR